MKMFSKALSDLAPWETPSSGQGQLAGLITLLAALLLFAGQARGEDLSVELQPSVKGSYRVEGRFWTPGDPSVAWQTLTDYNRLPMFVPTMESSEIREKSANSILVQQEAIGEALMVFHRHFNVLLRIKEQPLKEIEFEDTFHRDFRSYNGSWDLEKAAGGGTWINYQLQVTPNFFAPRYIVRNAFRNNAKELLRDVQAEIIRRGHLSETLLCCSQRDN